MAASGVEGEVGLVAVDELALAQALATLDTTVELAGHGFELLGREVLAVAAAHDLRQRARILGDLGRRRGGSGGGGLRGCAAAGRRGGLGQREDGGREGRGEAR